MYHGLSDRATCKDKLTQLIEYTYPLDFIFMLLIFIIYITYLINYIEASFIITLPKFISIVIALYDIKLNLQSITEHNNSRI